ncbi:MAG: transposase [Candidatus Delongbacteria bacterium]|nr:transposase [Candidatus Delongbacteria bacterium]
MKNRKSIRLKEYDYTLSGYYYVTIKTYNKLCLFGNINDGVMIKNIAGEMIEKIWKEIPEFYNGFEIHEFIIMPNHLHGIIEIKPSSVGSGSHVRPETHNKFPKIFKNTKTNSFNEQTNIDRIRSGQAWEPVPTDNTISLWDLMCRFKTMTTNKYIKLVKQNNAQRFYRFLWQRSYYEHIIRNKYDLHRIKKYIRNNPENW